MTKCLGSWLAVPSQSELPVWRFGEDHGAVSVPQVLCWHSEGSKAPGLAGILQSPKERWSGFDGDMYTQLTLHSFAGSRV